MTDINRILLNIDSNFFRHYSVLRIACTKQLWDRIDELKPYVAASCGIKAEKGYWLYVLTKESKARVRDVLEKVGIEFGNIKEGRELPLKLLINAVCRSDGYISVAGRNYYVSQTNFYSSDGQRLKSVVDIPEIRVDADSCISIHTVRFRKWKKSDEKAAYYYEDGNLIRTRTPRKEDCYVAGGIEGKKANPLSYLNTTESGYLKSRVSIIRSVVEKINELFQGYVFAQFDSAEDIAHFQKERITRCTENTEMMFLHAFAETGILSDIPQVYEMYDIKQSGSAQIKLIGPKDSYGADNEDPYVPSLSVQHVTEDTYHKALSEYQRGSKTLMRSLVRACLIELAIKKDVLEKKDSLNPGADELCVVIRDKENRFHYCRRKEDGELTFGSFTYFDGAKPDHIEDSIFDITESHIMIRNNIMYGIAETARMPLPAKNAFEEIKRTKGKVRNGRMRNELLGSILDVHIFKAEGKTYYYSGNIGNGMKPIVAKASTFMELVNYGGRACSDLSWIFNYIGVTYINAGDRFTKYPYLFKYLREWMHCCEEYENDTEEHI